MIIFELILKQKCVKWRKQSNKKYRLIKSRKI